MGGERGKAEADKAFEVMNEMPGHLDVYFFGVMNSSDAKNPSRSDKIRRGLSDANRAVADNDFATFEDVIRTLAPLVRQAMDEAGTSDVGGKFGLKKV